MRSARCNLLVRTGATVDGNRFLTGIDLDGRCSCGHDRGDHPGDGGCRRVHDDGPCTCARYAGVPPDVALERLLAILPYDVAVVRTARGYHITFFTALSVPPGKLPEYGAEIYGNGQALHIPPSVHPTGWRYAWVREPGDALPVVDLAALGLEPLPKGSSRPPKDRRGRVASRAPASPACQRAFARLMAQDGVVRGTGGDEHHLCPWHPDDRTRSLHVDWERARFHCFGCGEGGGLRRLRELVNGSTDAPAPTCNPRGEGEIRKGLQVGGDLPARREAALRLADAVEAAGQGSRAAKIRDCATTFDWNPARAQEWEAFVCPSGDSAPLRPVRPRSCDDHLCPVCMPQRLAADWNKRAQVIPEATRFTIVALRARAVSEGLADDVYLPRTRGGLREYRRARGIAAGFYGVTLVRDGAAWRAVFLLAFSDSDAASLTDGRSFTVELLQRGATPRDLLRHWQAAYLAEATAWHDAEELLVLQALTRGRRKFQGFGEHFGSDEAADAASRGEDSEPGATPLHRVAGGSGAAAQTPPCCPRCGATLQGIGRFDTEQMEVIAAPDGLPEWRWQERRAA